MKHISIHQKTGIEKRHDFLHVATKKTVISSVHGKDGNIGAILKDLSIKDLEKLVKLAKLRKKECYKYKNYFVHVSPDLSILMKGKGKK